MATPQPRHSMEEFARRGEEIYERDIRPTLKPGDQGKFIAIDIESGAFAIDQDDFAATQRLLSQLPDAQIWLVRAGEKAAYRIGGRSALGKPE